MSWAHNSSIILYYFSFAQLSSVYAYTGQFFGTCLIGLYFVQRVVLSLETADDLGGTALTKNPA